MSGKSRARLKDRPPQEASPHKIHRREMKFDETGIKLFVPMSVLIVKRSKRP